MNPYNKLAIVLLAALASALVTFSIVEHRELVRLRAQVENAAEAAPPPASRKNAPPSSGSTEVNSLTRALNEDAPNRLLKIRGLVDYVSSLKSDQLGGVLDAMNHAPKSSYAPVLKELLLSRWTDENPAAALSWARSQTNLAERATDMRDVIEVWADKDVHGALAALARVDDGPARNAAAFSLFSRLAQRDPRAALDTLLNLPIGQRTPELYGAVFSSWGGEDPAAATAAALALPASKGRTQALTLLARSWATQDPKAALAWAESLSAGSVRNGVLSAAMDTLARRDPQAAITYYGNLTNPADKAALLNTIATSWATQDPQGALAWVQSSATGHAGDRAVQGVLAQMAQADPAGAADLLGKISEASVRDGVLPQLAASWAQKDIQGALKWVENLPESDGVARADAFQNVLRAWAQADPVNAAAYVGNNAANPNFRAIADEVTRNWAAADPLAAIAWVQGLPEGSARSNAIRTALTTYAASDPQSAWNFAAQQMPDDGPDGIRLKTLLNIATVWSTLDPAQAAVMVTEFPPQSQAGIITTVAGNWIRQDPLAASQWITTLPPSMARDGAVAQLIAIEGRNDLPSAFNWALSVGSSSMKTTALTNVVRMWGQRAPNNQAVIDTLNAADLPEGQRAILLQLYLQSSKQENRVPSAPAPAP